MEGSAVQKFIVTTKGDVYQRLNDFEGTKVIERLAHLIYWEVDNAEALKFLEQLKLDDVIKDFTQDRPLCD